MEDPDERAKQAKREIGYIAQTELRALEKLTSMECSSTPTLLAKELATQGRDMPVPGGFIVYMLMNRLPGIPIDKFWMMDSMERQAIRDAFKTAYL